MELGLRYRPAAQAQVEGHRVSLAVLLGDVSDVPDHILERAVERWSKSNRFLPRSSELIALCQQLLTVSGEVKPITPEERVVGLNADLRAQGKFHMEWYVDNGNLRLRTPEPRATG